MTRSNRHSAPAGRARPADWVRVATRPGYGLGLLPAALSVQPVGTLLVLGLAATLAAARKAPRISPRR
ncbi:hypothetical protein [Rubellimicrobium mesophilum]|uniref:hypothetical protein n=1 Tax=Rubellimicrobium mesophilum TaxID=1123067 RepID=UPI0012E16B45|nr:hypothetical protein [Rubellimicrobium mesophilum]